MASSLTTFDAFLKERYTTDKIENLAYKDRPFLDMVPKDNSGSGDTFVHPVIYANAQGLAADITNAQTAAQQSGGGGNLKGKAWKATWGDYSGAIEIGDKVIAASRDNTGSFLRNKAAEIDSLYEAFGDTMGYYLFSDAGRHVATGTESSGVCTCTSGTETDIVNIEVGQILNASANDGTSAAHTLLGSGSAGYVIAVDRNAGTFTVSATAGGSAGTPSGWTGTMYFFRQGDFGGSGATRILFGAGAWIPSSAPGATSFENVDRTADITRLSGVRLASADTNGVGLEQRLKRLVTRMTGRAGGPGPTHLFLNPEKWQELADALESRGNRPLDGGTGKFNYSKLQLAMGGKMVEIYADRFCPVGTAFAFHMPTIKLRTLDGFPKVLDGDGLTMLRKSASNDYEHRFRTYPAVIFAAPGYCGRVATT